MTQNDPDPFNQENYNLIQFTQLGRIYDVLLTLVQLQNPDAAAHLIEAHAAGTLVAPSPDFTGEFLFDTVNGAFEDSANAPSPPANTVNKIQ